MGLSRPARAAKWLLPELAGSEPTERTESRLCKSAGGRYSRQEIEQGLALLRKRGHAEKDEQAWRRLHMPAKPWRLTPSGEAELRERVEAQAAREVERYRTSM